MCAWNKYEPQHLVRHIIKSLIDTLDSVLAVSAFYKHSLEPPMAKRELVGCTL